MKTYIGSMFVALALVAGVHPTEAQGATVFPVATNPVSPENTNKLALRIHKTTRAITGTFASPTNPKKTLTINRVLLQNQANAAGYFPGTDQSGAFLLENP